MRYLSLCAICCIAVATHAQNKQTAVTKIPVLRSQEKEIMYSINNEERQGWTISPELKPDRMEVGCKKTSSTVKFFTATDSATFTIHNNETKRFYILYNNDSALTEIAGVPANVNFTDAYIKEHKGKIEVEIPEVHELVNIAISLTRTGSSDSNMVDMTTPYYQEVVKHFAPYKEHALIAAMNKELDNPERVKVYWSYYAWKMNACGFVYKNDKIVNNGIIRKMGFDNLPNPIPDNAVLLEDFARKSHFREFYKAHNGYYTSLKQTYRQLNPINKMQNWLEKYFGREYGNYSVYFSPLIGGAHSTERFSDNGFVQTVMFVCRAEESPGVNHAVNEMLESRVVFTEIDHNFVNPVTDIYRNKLDQSFPRSKWADTASGITDGYPNSYTVFNEYMTWAIFSMYCVDNFGEQDYENFIPRMEAQMEKNRGYIHFKDFNRQVMALYKNNRKIPVNDLYKQMLQWCEKYAG